MDKKIISPKLNEKKYFFLWILTLLILVIVAGIGVFNILKGKSSGTKSNTSEQANSADNSEISEFKKALLPAEGIILPVRWNDLGKRLTETGVIDEQKLIAIYDQRGGLSEEDKKLLYDSDNGNIIITAQNSGFLLNLLWALGLGNKNPVLEKGPMQDPKYKGADRFASTGGWSIAKGNAMDHYSKHKFITLTPTQQELVEKVSKNIYRPCCGNSTYFPDCNHGMAMLGFLQLMASQGMAEEEMYKTALTVNTFWFPDAYLTIAKYFQKKKVAWEDVNPKNVLGLEYSSASGYKQVMTEVNPVQSQGGKRCGV
ncbi:hypothetical protein BMS3Abin15_00876 [bacterium BMS3Abin15]|nr:hypothetical protein BMS3Abin15_00876 [bacterium BMS3Abin15]HDZ84985.1 hypothetical protein [Candidatus Moranbacteria bacterium]